MLSALVIPRALCLTPCAVPFLTSDFCLLTNYRLLLTVPYLSCLTLLLLVMFLLMRKGGIAMTKEAIPGYTYGTAEVQKAPVTAEELELLKEAVLFTEEDAEYLRMSHHVLGDQVEDVLDVWYGFVGSHPHLVHYFGGKGNGQPDEEYLAAVRRRFGQWILDTAAANYDQKWLDYQYEIGLRHHRTKKNQTDGVASVDNIGYRYLPAFIYPITSTLKPFLGKKGHSAEEVEKMHQAWVKSVILQVTLWSHPYVKEGDY
jgi:hypothetical protein